MATGKLLNKLKKLILISVMVSNVPYAEENCFIATKDSNILKQTGNCINSRYSPCSTFKIAISLMGYDSKILIDKNSPKLEFKQGYVDFLPIWRQDYTPKMWIQNSCIWYSQEVTKNLGKNKFDNYIKALNYGNMDTTGSPDKNNGLTNCWLSNSLKISPNEQLRFIQQLVAEELPTTKYSQTMTKLLMYREQLTPDWKLYGKTGTGNKDNIPIGWFVGWIENNDSEKIVFVNFVERDEKYKITSGGIYAMENTIKELKKLV